VLLGRNRTRPRCTLRGAARGHGPCVWPTATRGMARLGLGWRSARGPARLASAAHGARRRCSVSRRRHGADAREAAEEQRLTGVGMVDGGAASTGEAPVGTAARSGRGRRGRGDGRGDGGAREAVGTWAAQRGDGGSMESGAVVGRERRGRGG
jgi:hypothetical protein